MREVTPALAAADLFSASGDKCAKALREIDWSTHPLGPPSGWPVELRTAVRLALSSRFPTMVHWGPELFTFYNEAYAARLDPDHAGLPGQPAQQWWADSWSRFAPTFSRVLDGESFYAEDALYPLGQRGDPGTAYFSHSHSPLWDDAGVVCGIYIVATETTARVQAEEERTRDEHRNRQILDSAIDYAIIATDLDGRVVSWNEGARQILGWTEDEMLGQTAARFFTPEDVATGRPEKEMIVALAQRCSIDERWHLRKSGERFWASGELTVLLNNDGEPDGFVKVMRDRTEQHEAQERLEASEARFQLALGAAGFLGSWDWDIVEDKVRADSLFAEYFSVPPELAAGGMPLATFIAGIHPDDRDWVGRRIMAAVATCGEFAEEYRLQRGNGAVAWVAARGRCLSDDQGRPTHFPGIAVEITERRAMESALRTSEMRTRQALEAAEMGAWEVTPDLEEQYWDVRARSLLGYSADEDVTIARLHERAHSEDSQRIAREVAEAFNGRDHGLDSQYRVLGKGGGQTWVHVRGRLVSAPDEPARIVGTVRDVTPQRVAEEQRALLTHELNHRIKNILAVVQSIVSQSLRRSETPALATHAIGQRLAALGRAHDLLTRTSWAAAPLQSVIDGALMVFERRSAQIMVDGPEVLLNSKAALAFAMALHELMTNAIKYGALATDTGKVDVRWRRLEHEGGGRKLALSWTESGGPHVTSPVRIGFGARLMQALSRDLGGESHATYYASGLEWTLVADLNAIEEVLRIGDADGERG